jgi:hypothetical protein
MGRKNFSWQPPDGFIVSFGKESIKAVERCEKMRFFPNN